jgi:hypothetical protein
MLRRVAYAFSLRLLLSFALGFLLRLLCGCLSASRFLLCLSLGTLLYLSLSTRLFSLLLLSLTRLTLSFLIGSCCLGGLPVCFPLGIRYLFAIAFLLAAVVYLLHCRALVLNLELLIPVVVGNTFHAHRPCQVSAERRLADIAADKNAGAIEFLSNARR